MSVKLMTAVFDRYPEGGGEMLVALKLADHADDDGSHIYPSIKYIAEKTRQSPRAVQYQIRRMEKTGFLVLVAHAGGGRGKAREYRISPDWINGAKLAPFSDGSKGAENAPNEKGANPAAKGATDDEKGANQSTKGRNTAVTAPFVVQGGQVFISQALIGTAWITNGNIADIIQATAVGANGQPRWRLDKNGTLTMNGANAGSGYLTISDSTVQVYDGAGTLRVRLGLW